MKKLLIILTAFLNVIMLSGCFKIATPEELLQVPELSSEKKSMIEAVENFRPQNTVTYPIFMKGDKSSSAMVIRDLDGDGSGEIISFYKKNSDDKVGVFILSKSDALWIKNADITFNSYEISKIHIEDLNNNGKKEIIVEAFDAHNFENPKLLSVIYYKDRVIKAVKEISYTAMQIYDINQDKQDELYLIKNQGKSDGYDLRIFQFENYDIKQTNAVSLRDISNPYDITIGNISENKKAMFIDYSADGGQENTQVYLYDNKHFKSLNEIETFREKHYVFNLPTADVNLDGIIEVGYKFKSPNYKVSVTSSDQDEVNGYFHIKDDYSLELISEQYESPLGFKFSIPKSFRGKYKINYKWDEGYISFKYIDSKGIEYPLVKLSYMRKYDYIKKKEKDETMQLLIEGQEYVIVGNVLDNGSVLTGQDHVNYINMRSDVLILSNLVKENL
nr:hypothetical protein [uncultured Criibacterium sp.]